MVDGVEQRNQVRVGRKVIALDLSWAVRGRKKEEKLRATSLLCQLLAIPPKKFALLDLSNSNFDLPIGCVRCPQRDDG